MALLAPQIDQLYSIIGLPESGSATMFFRTFSLYGPSATAYSYTQLTAIINAALAALTAGQQARMTALLTQWDANNLDFSEIDISSDGGTSGVISKAEAQRVNIRRTIDGMLGIGIPDEGFLEQLKRELKSTRGGGPRLVK